jgi:hypothetical protein
VEIPYASKLWIQEMETFANMSMRMLTTYDTTRLRGLETTEAMTQERMNGLLTQKLERVRIETTVPDLAVKPDYAPTAAQVADELERLQAEATAAFQEDADRTAASSRPLAPPLPQNEGLEAAPTVSAVVPLANATLVAAPQPAIELAPGSVAPSAIPVTLQGQPMGLLVQPQEGLVMQTAEGVPVLNVDTTDAALKAQGLSVPGDATAPIVAQPSLLAPETVVRRKPRRSAVQSAVPPPNVFAAGVPATGEQQGGGDAAPSAPLTVIKLG